jgi:ParB family transcriptional regulator, chromosome partitioning protein
MTASLPRPGGLGRGLGALIPHREERRDARELPISEIARNPYQPRQEFDPQDLAELSASIAEHGVLQPILVNETVDGYVLVAGERRLRAAQLAGLERIPAVVRSLAEREQLALALVENMQRADLAPLDEARAFRRLMADFGLTQEEVAARVGRSRPAIANTLRLLDLPTAVQEALAQGAIAEGHARALAGLTDESAQLELLRTILARHLSVRQVEDAVRRWRDETGTRTRGGRRSQAQSPELERLTAGLRSALATKVSINPGRRGGRITIEYYDDDDLGRLFERLTGGGA